MDLQKDNSKALSSILIYGNSIAALQAALALSKALNNGIEISLVCPPTQVISDSFYGGSSGAEAYKFHLDIGLSEPELFLHTNASFSFGTHYQNWLAHKSNWMQSYNLPLHAFEGVAMHQLLTKHKEVLQDHLVGAQAALAGKFAHPPTDNKSSALSRAEYGYHFDYRSYHQLLQNKLKQSRVKVINASLLCAKKNETGISSLHLDSNAELSADLYIDCSGDKAELLSVLDKVYHCSKSMSISASEHVQQELGAPCKQVKAMSSGYQLSLPLQGKTQQFTLTLFDENKGSDCLKIGHRPRAWIANCLALSHAAAVQEPISPAPFKLLVNDINRLLSLIPTSTNMSMESKEYNRCYYNDVLHAEIYNQALYDQRLNKQDICETNTVNKTATGFWSQASSFTELPALLERKVAQFISRGLVVTYDLEPFNAEDWLILHSGIGRKPWRYDRLADQIDDKKMQEQFTAHKLGLKNLAKQMPPHHIYVQKFVNYIKENQ